MTPQEIKNMIRTLNEEAMKQGGKLTDLALPQDMYEEFYYSLNSGKELPIDFLFEGVRIHTGDND